MTYSDDFILAIKGLINSKKMNDTEIINILKISRDTFYKIKKDIVHRSNSKKINKKTKITKQVNNYICSYVTRNINFNYKKLINLIHKRFNLKIGKSTLYNILKKNKIKKKP